MAHRLSVQSHQDTPITPYNKNNLCYTQKMQGKPHNFSSSDFEMLKMAINQKGYFKIKIISGSMEPLIKTGQELIVNKLTDNLKLKKFDILVFWNGSLLICHYLWHTNQLTFNNRDLYITRPLLAREDDFPIERKNILGIVTEIKIPWYLRLRLLFNYK